MKTNKQTLPSATEIRSGINTEGGEREGEGSVSQCFVDWVITKGTMLV